MTRHEYGRAIWREYRRSTRTSYGEWAAGYNLGITHLYHLVREWKGSANELLKRLTAEEAYRLEHSYEPTRPDFSRGYEKAWSFGLDTLRQAFQMGPKRGVNGRLYPDWREFPALMRPGETVESPRSRHEYRRTQTQRPP